MVGDLVVGAVEADLVVGAVEADIVVGAVEIENVQLHAMFLCGIRC